MLQRATKITYGTAEIQGFGFQDKVCLDEKAKSCAPDFTFLASYESTGLDASSDGILGLSPNHDPDS